VPISTEGAAVSKRVIQFRFAGFRCRSNCISKTVYKAVQLASVHLRSLSDFPVPRYDGSRRYGRVSMIESLSADTYHGLLRTAQHSPTAGYDQSDGQDKKRS